MKVTIFFHLQYYSHIHLNNLYFELVPLKWSMIYQKKNAKSQKRVVVCTECITATYKICSWEFSLHWDGLIFKKRNKKEKFSGIFIFILVGVLFKQTYKQSKSHWKTVDMWVDYMLYSACMLRYKTCLLTRTFHTM